MKLSHKPSISVALLSMVFSSPKPGDAFSIVSSSGSRSQPIGNEMHISPRTALHAASNDDGNDSTDDDTPFWWLSPNLQSPKRRARLAREEEIRSRFVKGDELRKLREDTSILKGNLKLAEAMGDIPKVSDLRDAIKRAEDKDAELVYARSMEFVKQAKKLPPSSPKRKEVVAKYTREAKMARTCIPSFNLEGLWIGNYGKHGSELINVTYTGDTLVATKVTGDKHVPRGEISFKANLASQNEEEAPPLEPIELSETAASKWGVDKLQRYPGQGRIAAEGFKENKYVDSQLIMFEDYFSFVWVPTKHHVFFSRPSPQLTIHMLRDIISEEDEVDNMRDHIARCFDMDAQENEMSTKNDGDDSDPFRRILREDDLVSFLEEREETKQSKFAFWKINKWKKHIDEVLGDNNE